MPDRLLDSLSTWPVPHASAAVLRGGVVVERRGDATFEYRLASLSKMITAWVTLVACEEGTVSLDDAVGPTTLRHLLAHAGGYGFDGSTPIMGPGKKRIYSNTGIEMAAAHVARCADMEFATYMREAVFEPLNMKASALRGSPAFAVFSTLDDTCRFVAELMRPSLVSEATARDAVTVQFPDLSGVVPGLGSFRPCPWGLGIEIRGDKSPHWTGSHNSPRTFGHFGGSGTMAWVDPEIDVALVALTDRDFDSWAAEALVAWSTLSDIVIDGVRA